MESGDVSEDFGKKCGKKSVFLSSSYLAWVSTVHYRNWEIGVPFLNNNISRMAPRTLRNTFLCFKTGRGWEKFYRQGEEKEFKLQVF